MNTYLPIHLIRDDNFNISGGSLKKSTFKIAIPTYDRPQYLKKSTLNYLDECKINHKDIFIFVDNKQQEEIYKKEIDNSYNLIRGGNKGKLGHDGINNFILDYFKQGEPILFLHDDLIGLYKSICSPKPHQKKITTDLTTEMLKLINYMKKENTILGGVNNSSNNMWNCNNKTDYRKDLPFVPSFVYMLFIDKQIKLPKGVINDDIDRSFRIMEKYGSIVRLNKIWANANSRTLEGGLDKTNVDNKVKQNLIKLKKEFPQYLKEIVEDKSSSNQNYKWKPIFSKVI